MLQNVQRGRTLCMKLRCSHDGLLAKAFGAMRRFLGGATCLCGLLDPKGRHGALPDNDFPVRWRGGMPVKAAMKGLKFVVERHRDGYVAYPLGLKGAVVGEGESYESALADAKSGRCFSY